MRMSVYGRTEIDSQGAEADTGAERSAGGRGDGGVCGRADGSERAPCMATTGSVQVQPWLTGTGAGSRQRPRRRRQCRQSGSWPRASTEASTIPISRCCRSGRASICPAPPSGGYCWQRACGVRGAAGPSAGGSATGRRGCCCRLTAAHDWLEGRGPYLTLVGAVDDATGTVPAALFRQQEDTHGYLLMSDRSSSAKVCPWPCTATGTASSSAPPRSPRASPIASRQA